MKLKSRLAANVFDDPESAKSKSFRRDLAVLLELSETDIVACLSALPDVQLARTASHRDRLLDKLVGERPQDRQRWSGSLGVLRFFLDALLSRDIPPSDSEVWAVDFVELGWLHDSVLHTFFQNFS